MKLIRQQVNINKMQLSFMPAFRAPGTILRQLQEIYSAKKEYLYIAFVDFEKVFEGVPKDVAWCVLRNLGVKGWFFRYVQSMHRDA